MDKYQMNIINRQFINEIKLVFLHIPKTGGTFIEKKLQYLNKIKYNNNRIFAGHYSINLYNKEFKDYIFFCVIRNPYNRLYSFWGMILKSKDSIFKKNLMKLLNNPTNFTEFVNKLYYLFKEKKVPWLNYSGKDLDKYLSNSYPLMVHLYPQYLYLIDHDKNIKVKKNCILKYENLDKDFKNFNDLYFNDKKDIYSYLNNNIYKHINIKKDYDIKNKFPDLVDKIYEIYIDDFIYFNYDK